ncbi:Putative acid--amine ligase YgiC [Gemmata obscuriglobus]|uniref:Glutathionylspermidine synthase family protein n=1 Tax=Gemmata obscuriglobus TaxID=114 RepID=A0A2Z3H480_9BACT|nr:glutathionylspermidine synthase family protein [Gemmata obscuriglobus]AWM37915.1 glutathionylspermidine synthase family protein [Gemmata obscuriglobus]QEG29230.1 Putative acid--amine ligase YgiC [Gemmata obscuriglobus]VTS08037.1 Glutathionylspermidine synthase OS=Methylomonas sp. FJG1 GN=JT25_04155 PE=4 SV=1: GSP_synth [Gemmata obscuriglobus UQM 2246]
MRRVSVDPRPNWQKRVEEFGLFYHTLRGEPYWDESAYYQFTEYEVERLYEATTALHKMCLDLVQDVIDKRLFGLFMIPQEFEQYIIRSWENDEPSVYGRFDLAYDGAGPPKLLEYNADTPTGLVEASVAQWMWLKDVDERGNQFNSIHEELIEAWKEVLKRDSGPIHFAAMTELDTPEDYITAEYMRDVAIQAGAKTTFIDVAEIGYDRPRKVFVDNTGFPIHRCFKLYPWEWMVREEFGPHLGTAPTRWVEPPWKMILSCKSILPLLYERHPDSPFLLPASFDPLTDGSYVKKPVHAREGANIEVVMGGRLVQSTDGPYQGGPYVYQALAPQMKPHDGRYPVIGSWVVNGVACGMGIREDDSLVTRNTSRFVPHQMVG